MRKYAYVAFNELGEEKTESINEKEILESCWNDWSKRNKDNYQDVSDVVKEGICLQEWVVANFAWCID